MALFYCDSVWFGYSDIQTAVGWWQQAFDAKPAPTPEWDSPPAAALLLPGAEEPSIGIYGDSQAPGAVPVIFTGNIKKAHAHFEQRGVVPGPIQGDSPKYFEIRDCEGHLIEISEEP